MVWIVIVNWNGGRVLGECLEGLRRQAYRDFSAIVIDNGSTDGSIDLVKQRFPEVRVMCLGENVGFCAANNVALRLADGKYAALLNNDAVPDPLWLQQLVDGLENCPEAGLAASKMILHDDRTRIDRAGDGYSIAGTGVLRGRGDSVEHFGEREFVFGASAGAALYRLKVFEDIGFFDEDFFLLYEDVDLSFRAQLRGYRCLYVPEAIVYHRGSWSIGRESATSVYYGHRNLEWVYVKNMPTALLLRTLWLHSLYDLGCLVYFALHGRGRAFVRAKVDAFKSLKKFLRKRREVQGSRRVADRYISSLLEREGFIQRLQMRRARHGIKRGQDSEQATE